MVRTQDRKKKFQQWCEQKAGGAGLIDVDWERMVAFYWLPKEHWKHLRTTNAVESFAAVRLRTTAATRYKKGDRRLISFTHLLTESRTHAKIGTSSTCSETKSRDFLGQN